MLVVKECDLGKADGWSLEASGNSVCLSLAEESSFCVPASPSNATNLAANIRPAGDVTQSPMGMLR